MRPADGPEVEIQAGPPVGGTTIYVDAICPVCGERADFFFDPPLTGPATLNPCGHTVVATVRYAARFTADGTWTDHPPGPEPSAWVTGPCHNCGTVIGFDPELVPGNDGTVADPISGEPVPGPMGPEGSYPRCQNCVDEQNQIRADNGLDPIVVPDGAYAPT